MDELSAKERLFQFWMIYTTKTDPKALLDYIELFIETYQDLIDYNLNHLTDGFSEEGPHLTKLPDGILQVLGNQLNQCCYGDDTETIKAATDIVKCLIVLCRNYDNVQLVASCEFTSYVVNIATTVVNKIKGNLGEDLQQHIIFVKLTLHFFECLYDPYFIWRKRLLGWTVEQSRLNFKPALLHVEIIPFFHDCFQKSWLPSDLKVHLIHVFGAIISGSQHNALSAVTPATLDVLLKILAASGSDKPTNEQREEMSRLKNLVLKCMVRMVHVIHCCSPDLRQVEVSHVMEGYMQVLLDFESQSQDDPYNDMQLSMIGAINEMLSCDDRSALQVILVGGGTFDAFVSLLQKTALCGLEAQNLAMSVLKVMTTVLAGSGNAKERFKLRVGYGKFVEVLKSLGQPSMDLLKSVLSLVVEGVYEENCTYTVHNTHAAIMLIQWLPDIQSHDLQIWLMEHLRQLCSSDHNNKMNCCNNGMIGAILSVLGREKQINPAAVSHLIGLLESLGTQSITAIELKQLIGLLRLDEEENQNTYCSRLMRGMSTMARREGKEGALHFFNIQDPTDGIHLPGIRKWPGAAFSFHTWLCLNSHVDRGVYDLPASQSCRRIIYSFLSNSGCGFECFVSDSGELTVAVFSKKDYNGVTVHEVDLQDGHWHDVCVVHTNSKRPFITSQLYVYVDGKQKHNSQLKYPNMSEPLTSCRVGSMVWQSQSDAWHTESHLNSTTDNKKTSPLKSFLQHAVKSNGNIPGVDSIPTGSQDDTHGLPIPLNGQIGSVCIFHDAVSINQVKRLYAAGPNNLTVFNDDSELQDLPGKMVLYYNARACKNTHIMDLSTNQNHGQLLGQKCVTWDIKDVINCIGGIQVLFPLLEQVNRLPSPPEISSPEFKSLASLNKATDQEDWVILPSSSYADTKLEQNQVAGFLTLLRNMVQTKPVNQQTFVQTNGAAVIGALLQKVNCKLIDVNVLMAVQLLVEATASTNRTMLHHMYQYILFDFRIWSRSDFPVRIGHIQYLSTIIKDDRRHFRKMFGVQYILDVIRSHYSNDCVLSEEDARTIRVSLLSLVKYYIVRDITVEELSAVFHFMMACKDENMICEALDIVISLLDGGRKQDQTYLLMFEPHIGEMLYGLLTIKGFTIIYYEKIVKVLYILLKTDRVYEKSKARLRLTDCGYLGLIGLIQGFEVSGPTIKRFLEQVMVVDTPQSYNAVLAVLQLIYTSGFDIKLEASRQLLSILVSKNGAAKSFAKQLGWQEAFSKLFILRPISLETSDLDQLDCDITMETQTDCDENSAKGGDSDLLCLKGDSSEQNTEDSPLLGDYNSSQSAISPKDCVRTEAKSPTNVNKLNCDSEVDQKSDKENCDSKSVQKPSPPNQLNLSAGGDATNKVNVESFSPPLDTPSTPLYLKSQLFDDLAEDELRPMSRSSSASAEDLSTIAQRAAERKSLHKETSSSSISQLSQSESGLDLTEEVEMRRDSLSSSWHQNNTHRMLNSLGLRGSFLMDVVENSEELCQNLLIVLYTVMWKGVEGSDEAAWKERGQVFAWLDHISQTNELMCPVPELKRRLLEMMLHACTSDIKDAGHSSQPYMENAIELVRLVRYSLFRNEACMDGHMYSEMLLEDVMSLLDSLAVWDVPSGAGWQEMVHLGLSVIMAFAQNDQLELCASATARLHMLVQTKLISSSAEAAYLIGHLNSVIVKAVDAATDNYSFLIPVMKALIDKSYQLLNLDLNLPNLPSTTMSPTFFDDFKTYCKTEEWTTFINNYVEPQKQHFTENVFMELTTKTAEFWSNCQQEMMVNMHKRNREHGESKLKFQNQILDVYNKKVTNEEKRFQNVTTQLRNQHAAALRQWRAAKRFFTGERGAWAQRESPVLHWKLSNQENFSRMKVKLIQNYNFDIHREASLLRDNLGVEDNVLMDEIQQLMVTKEALVSRENIGDDGIGDEDWNVISAQSTNVEEYQDKEKLVLSEECELVTLVEVIKGRLEVTTTHVYFFDCSTTRDEGGEDFKWGLPQLREIHFRRYNLRRSALEMFLIDQTNYFLNFQKKVRNKVYSRILGLRPPNLIYYGSRSPAELLKASGLTQKWVQREISNFEYLMQLNTIAGRTYNDLSQYPVFPWILCDYTSDTLDLDKPEVFRDLTKPVGALNPRNEEEVREKFDHFEDPTGVIEKFHYGTHYSNSATVMHYMIRMEPFTTLHIALQSGRFDVADRQFHSIPGTWKSMYNNPNDVKELIPEFFYLPEFLSNRNEFDLGKLQISKEVVNDVILPKWAATPEDFIYKHRKALESEYVSNNLHNWIDLIFGYKQKGPAAVEALNVFYYCTYEGAVDLDAVKDANERKALEGMINNFGQTPCQLLKDPHPRRMNFDEVVAKAMKTDKHLSVYYFLDQLKVYFVELSSEADPLVYIAVPRSQPRSIIQHGMLDTLVTVSSQGILGTHGWLPYDKSITNYFTFDKDPSVSNLKTRKKFNSPFAPGIEVSAKLFVVTHDSKLLISGGHWDNSLQVYHIGKGRRINHICRHIDIVTCLALDYCGSHLITGSRDTTCMIWQVQQQGGVCVNLSNKPLQTLYGHDNEVTAVHISSELDMAVSASKDGTVMIHTVRKGHYMRTLRPSQTPGYNLNIPILTVDDMGQIVIYCHETLPIDPKVVTSLHLYSLNGKRICTQEVQSHLGHIIIKGDNLITGDVDGNVVVYEIFGLKQLTSIPLIVPIHSLALTNGNSHLLAGLKDGKLIIIGIKSLPEIR
ncbi:neurobeachin-like protein 1 [Mercenaria mercenaria]|uniref:neurobeachin-like protein 1 n=1 Tax=Mercenaria mercenaria TaxID=6596 RepID=UPI00234F9055|nr:neurobeachin-like protein 1 [Mercenaria mercenaria]